jgi:chromosome segregation ATPase
MRLEFIRQERAREEARGKQGAGPGQSMLREQGRQLDSKVRREEENLATIQRKIELAEVEEERRREKVADMERKLAELKADIAEAERKRSDVRHQADLVQTELRNYESALDRVRRMAESD